MKSLDNMLLIYYLIFMSLIFSGIPVINRGLEHLDGFPWRRTSRQVNTCGPSEQCVTMRYCVKFMNRNLGRNAVGCNSNGNRRRRPKKYCCPIEENSIEFISRGGSTGGNSQKENGVENLQQENKVENLLQESADNNRYRISNHQECGLSKTTNIRQPYIKGGDNAPEGAFLWMAALVRKSRFTKSGFFTCGAFLIDRRHLLTAAHCFKNNDASNPKRFFVRLGTRLWWKGPTFNLARIAIHPGYKQGSLYDDIALLTLAKEVKDPNIIPICLPEGDVSSLELTGQGATVAGWGALEYNGEVSSVTSPTLKYLDAVPIIPNSACFQALSQQVPQFRRLFGARGLTKGMICAGFLEGGKDSCKGDSGGPLMIRYQQRYYAIGIVSFGFGCGRPGHPAGYTKISEYMDFIRRNL